MAGGGPLPVREYTDAAQMRRDAAALRARMFAPRPRPVAAEILAELPVKIAVEPGATKPWAKPQVKQIGFISPQAASFCLRKKLPPHPLVRLLSKVSRATGVTMTDIRSDRRPADVIKARHIHYYVARTLTTYSLPEIGRRAGGKDHTSVLHGVRRVQAVVDRLNIELPKSRFAMAKALWAADWAKVSQ